MIIGVTGHRLQYLGGYSEETYAKLLEFAKQELAELLTIVNVKDTFEHIRIGTGMALGWDQAIVEACVYYHIPFVAYIPFIGYELKWPQAAQNKYHSLLEKAFKIIYTDGMQGNYASYKLFKRNEFIVNDCEMLLALWNGDIQTGTGHCVQYAKSQNKRTINCWDNWIHA